MILFKTALEVLNLLSISTDPPPMDPLVAILDYLKTNSRSDRKFLKSDAEHLHHTPGMDIKDYLKQHQSLRARVTGAQYLSTFGETTFVDLFIDGLRFSSESVETGPQLLPIVLITSEDFFHSYKHLHFYNSQSITFSFYAYPPPASPVMTIQKPRNPNLQRRTQTRPPGFRPCTFHQQFMRISPNNTNKKCRDKRH